MQTLRFALALAALTFVAVPTASADHRYQGYYYPEVAVEESYEPRAARLPQASRELRIAFVTGISAEQGQKGYPAQVIAFTKGGEDDSLIFTALYDGPLSTVYRTRAFFAQMTSVARLLPAFQNEAALAGDYTFFDLAYMMGFNSIAASDGEGFAYRVILDPAAEHSE